MKLTKEQKLFIRAGRILEAYRHDLKMTKQGALIKIVIAPQLKVGKNLLKKALEAACAEHRKEQNNGNQ